MISLISPQEALTVIATKTRERRVGQGFTQNGLAARAGVSLAVLRKFERTGKISLESLLKLALVLQLLPDIVAAFTKTKNQPRSLDELLQPNETKRQRGWIK